MAQNNLYEWVDRFKRGRRAVGDERPDWPSTSRTDNQLALVNYYMFGPLNDALHGQ